MLLHRLKSLLASSAAVPILIVFLALDVMVLAGQPGGSRGSVGQWLIDASRSRRCRCGGHDDTRRSYRFDLFRGANGSIAIHGASGWDSAKGSIDHVIVLVDYDDKGFYAPTTYSRWAKVIGPSIPELLPQQNELRRRILDRSIGTLGVMNVGSRRQALINGKVAHLDGISFLGIAHNTISLAAFAMLCWSIPLNIHKLSPSNLLKGFHTIPIDACPHCRYSTIGLTTDTCPECGNCISTSD